MGVCEVIKCFPVRSAVFVSAGYARLADDKLVQPCV
jgi:hypothetical protein